MTREYIIKLAQEAGLGNVLCHNSVEGDRIWIEGADWHDELERFHQLAVANVLEACAALLETNAMACENPIHRSLLQANAAEIRALGQEMPLFDDWPGGFNNG